MPAIVREGSFVNDVAISSKVFSASFETILVPFVIVQTSNGNGCTKTIKRGVASAGVYAACEAG
jgi:hypothetical protein